MSKEIDDGSHRADPSALTREAVNAALAQGRRDMALMREVLEARLDAMDAATELREMTLNAVPTNTAMLVGNLQSLHSEKFTSVAQQFKERDIRSEREARDNKVAVDAAFAAQKEAASEQNKSNTLAISKSEAATAETINKLAELFAGSIKSLTDKVDDLRDRLNNLELRLSTRLERGEGVTTGSVNANDKSSRTIMAGIAALAVLISLVGLVLGFTIK